MKVNTLLKTSFSSLLNHKVRSFLSMIGIIIGIASVITIFSLGQGLKEQQIENFKKWANVEEGKVDVLCEPKGADSENPKFNESDLYLIKQVRGVEDAQFKKEKEQLNCENVEIHGNKESRLISTEFDEMDKQEVQMVCGERPNELQSEAKEKVVMIDSKAAKLIAGSEDKLEEALDSRIKIQNEVFRVIGVYQASEWVRSLIVPQGTFAHYFRNEKSQNTVSISLSEGTKVADIQSLVVSKLEKEGSMRSLAAYQLTDNAKFLDKGAQELGMIQMIITAIGAISLLVACIGVMNMMFIAVAERTREIGIRRAMGAKKREIRLQFLLEGCALTLVGGIIGYILGILLANVFGASLRLSIHPGIGLILVAIAISTIVGLIASFLPAVKAANKNLIEVLR